MTTVREALTEARTRLVHSDSAALDAELLLGHALTRPRTFLHAWPEFELPAAERGHFEALLGRRAAGEPIAYLLGRCEFRSLDFAVTPAVLIPRPETEGLVEIALEHLRAHGVAEPSILDVGTGSGCIAIALAHARPDAGVVASDAAAAALDLARANATRLGVERVAFARGDWFAPLGGRCFDVIVSNPPYVRSDDPHLQRGDTRFEPRLALDGGADGLGAIRALVDGARSHLAADGLLLLEHGAEQGEAVAAILAGAGWSGITTRMDAAGLPRYALARCPTARHEQQPA